MKSHPVFNRILAAVAGLLLLLALGGSAMADDGPPQATPVASPLASNAQAGCDATGVVSISFDYVFPNDTDVIVALVDASNNNNHRITGTGLLTVAAGAGTYNLQLNAGTYDIIKVEVGYGDDGQVIDSAPISGCAMADQTGNGTDGNGSGNGGNGSGNGTAGNGSGNGGDTGNSTGNGTGNGSGNGGDTGNGSAGNGTGNGSGDTGNGGNATGGTTGGDTGNGGNATGGDTNGSDNATSDDNSGGTPAVAPTTVAPATTGAELPNTGMGAGYGSNSTGGYGILSLMMIAAAALTIKARRVRRR